MSHGKNFQLQVMVDGGEKNPRQGQIKRENFYSLEWFKFPGLKFMEKNMKKQVVEERIANLSREEVPPVNLEKRERAILQEQGRYELDKALFDGKVKIPKKIREISKQKADNKKKDEGVKY